MRIPLAEYVGNEIQRFRESFFTTVEDMATEVGVSPAMWSQWERGRGRGPSLAQLDKIADLWEVSVGELFPEARVYVHRKEPTA